ncbi:MAG: alpha/beta fold hydrolase [Bacteroidetes bacterium]|nr:alpha/beta fold hydrolase [Bacteroidota bacterium]
MSEKIKKSMLYVGVLAGGYLLICLFMFFLQEKFIFFPEKLPVNHTFSFRSDIQWEEIWIENEGVRINSLLFKADSSKGVILYFHGNAGSLQGWGYVAQDFTQLGWDVLILDYRGFGKSEGRPTYQALLDDGQKAYNYLLQYYQPSRINIYGRSVGSGIAAYVAAQNHPKGLILETPYTSMIRLSQHHYRWLPVKWLHKYPFSVTANLPAIDCPVSIIHGTLDRVSPVSHSRELFEKYPQKVTRYEEIQGGTHNDLSQYEPFRKFLLDVL